MRWGRRRHPESDVPQMADVERIVAERELLLDDLRDAIADLNDALTIPSTRKDDHA